MEYILDFWKGMFDFKGKATRKEFWVGYLVNYIIYRIIVGEIKWKFEYENELLCRGLVIALSLVMMIAIMAALARRMRDAGLSPWFAALDAIPYVRFVALILACIPTAKEKVVTYDSDVLKPVLQCSICNGEQMAGFKNRDTGEFTSVMLIHNEKDLEDFKMLYHIEGEIEKQY